MKRGGPPLAARPRLLVAARCRGGGLARGSGPLGVGALGARGAWGGRGRRDLVVAIIAGGRRVGARGLLVRILRERRVRRRRRGRLGLQRGGDLSRVAEGGGGGGVGKDGVGERVGEHVAPVGHRVELVEVIELKALEVGDGRSVIEVVVVFGRVAGTKDGLLALLRLGLGRGGGLGVNLKRLGAGRGVLVLLLDHGAHRHVVWRGGRAPSCSGHPRFWFFVKVPQSDWGLSWGVAGPWLVPWAAQRTMTDG
mmetsp:Transcript_37294/g.95245  ORF Transcript_37294/g.95245 Transcript_37294/m.95245 type:complete len:252 (+) Transcript_37294:625-1380(+)